jgi:mannose-6-phosphate isomerase-like protein (cupin superfamily)
MCNQSIDDATPCRVACDYSIAHRRAAEDGGSFVVPPDGGDTIWDGPIGTIVKISNGATGGLLSVCEMPVAAGYMVPPHVHDQTDEWSYVLEGTVGARIGDDEFAAEPGCWILKPRGLMHTFWNAGPGPARIIELITPGSFEHFFRQSTDLARSGDLTDELLEKLGLEHSTTVSMDWVEDLAAATVSS